MKTIRVFPRKTNATPDDDLVRINVKPDLFDSADEVHISVTFTWDIPAAEKLAQEWKYVAPVKMGGPAFNEQGGEFVPGQYLKKGYVITSRGCPNRCWFCAVPKREGNIVRELPITEGYNLLDDNILACSESHIDKVFEMLKRSSRKAHQPVILSGGLEAKRITPNIVDKLSILKPKYMFFAYDTQDDYEPLVAAGKLLKEAGFTENHMRCYVLCGYPKDTPEKAIKRFIQTHEAGFMPMSMVYRDFERKTSVPAEWRKIPHTWARPAATKAELKKIIKNREGKGE